MSSIQSLPVLRGLISRSSMHYGVHSDQCPKFGLFEPVYQADNGTFLRAAGRHGYVTGFAPLDAAAVERGLVPFGNETPAPAVSDPVEVGLLCRKPDGTLVCICAPWDEVANFSCGEAHAAVSEQMRQYPVEGYNLAHFLTVEVDQYVQHAIGGGGFDPQANEGELKAFSRIREELRASHPEWHNDDPPAVRPRWRPIDPTLN